MIVVGPPAFPSMIKYSPFPGFLTARGESEMQFRSLPSVDRVMASDAVAALTTSYPRDWVVDLVRQQLDQAREQIRQGGTAPATW